MTLKELQAYILELSPYQLDQIAVQVVKYLNLNEQLILEYRNIEQTCSSVGFYNSLIVQHQI